MDITLCLIVKNEEKNLAQCLTSFEGLYKQLVVVDTGSSDQSKIVASQFGAAIFDYTWKDDFASARNYSLSKAETDWVMMVDADDVIDLEDKISLQKKLITLPANIKGVFLPYLLPPFENGRKMGTYIPRIWRRSLHFKYTLPIHEYLDISQNDLVNFIRLDFSIKHTKSKENFTLSFQRNLKILKKAVKLYPNDKRILFYLGHDHHYSGEFLEAIYWYERYIKNAHVHKDELNRVFVNKGICHLKIGEKERASESFMKALEVQPDFIEPYFYLADFAFQKKDYTQAAQFYLKAMELTPPLTHVFINQNFYEGLASQKLKQMLDKISPNHGISF